MSDVERRLRELLHARASVISHLDLRGVLQAIVASAAELLDAPYAALSVLRTDGEVEDFFHVGISPDTAARLPHPPRPVGVLGAVLRADDVVSVADITKDPRSQGFPAHHPPMRSFAGVPIRVRDEAYGNLYVAHDAPGGFDDTALEALRSLAVTAGIAIDNAHKVEEVQRRAAWNQAAAHLTQTLLGGQVVHAASLLAESVAALTEAPFVAVAESLDADTACLDVVVGDGTAHLQGLVIDAAGTIVSEALAAEKVLLRETGTLVDVELGPSFAVPLTTPAGRPATLLVAREPGGRAFAASTVDLAQDLASRASIAFELARARADRERLALIEDRGRIARDLHDHVIQRLFGAGLSLQALSVGTVDDHVRQALPEQIDSLDQAIAEIRTAIFALRQRPQDQQSLRHRIIDLVGEFEGLLVHTPRTMFAGTVDLTVRGALADDVVAVVREGLSNIVKHAHARHVRVMVAARDAQVTVEVTDDGVGAPADPDRRSGIGNLAERARARGGAFTLTPGPAHGTVLTWTVPVTEEDRS